MNIDCYNGIDDYTVAGHDGYWKVSEVVRENSKWWNKPDTTFYLYNESGEKLMTTTPPIPVHKYRTKEYIATMKDHIAKCCGNVWDDVLEDELVISGDRQTGKTTAVKEVIKDLEERGIVVYVDSFRRMFGESDYQFNKGYFLPAFIDNLRGYSLTGKTLVVITDEHSDNWHGENGIRNILIHTRPSKIIPIKIWTPPHRPYQIFRA
jgi:hypothetical protein